MFANFKGDLNTLRAIIHSFITCVIGACDAGDSFKIFRSFQNCFLVLCVHLGEGSLLQLKLYVVHFLLRTFLQAVKGIPISAKFIRNTAPRAIIWSCQWQFSTTWMGPVGQRCNGCSDRRITCEIYVLYRDNLVNDFLCSTMKLWQIWRQVFQGVVVMSSR